jgi:hypothetical protein
MLAACASQPEEYNEQDDEKHPLIEIHETLRIFNFISYFFKQ